MNSSIPQCSRKFFILSASSSWDFYLYKQNILKNAVENENDVRYAPLTRNGTQVNSRSEIKKINNDFCVSNSPKSPVWIHSSQGCWQFYKRCLPGNLFLKSWSPDELPRRQLLTMQLMFLQTICKTCSNSTRKVFSASCKKYDKNQGTMQFH